MDIKQLADMSDLDLEYADAMATTYEEKLLIVQEQWERALDKMVALDLAVEAMANPKTKGAEAAYLAVQDLQSQADSALYNVGVNLLRALNRVRTTTENQS